MTEETNWKQFLTEEVLKERRDANNCPGGDLPNRTFDNRDDMAKLYRYVYEDGKWDDFFHALWREHDRLCNPVYKPMIEYIAWLFCLDCKRYKDRAKFVAEFYGWKETKAVLERLKGRKHPEDHPDVELMCENDAAKITT
jgi:hypothetical protein